jgi:hypothetical protein
MSFFCFLFNSGLGISIISDMLIDEFGVVVMSFEGLGNTSSTHPVVLNRA